MEIISKDFCLTNLIEPYKEIYTIPFLTKSFCESVINEAKQILDVEDVISSILLVEDLRIVKN